MLLIAGLLAFIRPSLAVVGCGRHSRQYFGDENYIVGGRNVEYSDSVVSVQVFKSDEWWNDHRWKHICGGVLVNKRWVLTAAHCIKEAREWGAARIVLGSTKIKGTNRQEISARRMFEHPEWTPISRTNDVALIELRADMSPSYEVSPACINSDIEEVIDAESCVALGWGKAHESSEFSENLQAVSLNLLSYPQCARAYRNLNGVRVSKEFHICAGRMGERGRGICQGDLGGPLFCQTSTRAGVELVGIATNGATCGSPQHPGIFIRLDSFLQWMRETTGDWSIGELELATEKPIPEPSTDEPDTETPTVGREIETREPETTTPQVWEPETTTPVVDREETVPTPTTTPVVDREETATSTPVVDQETTATSTPVVDQETVPTPTTTPVVDREETATSTPVVDREETATSSPVVDQETTATATSTPVVDQETVPTPMTTPVVDREETVPTPMTTPVVDREETVPTPMTTPVVDREETVPTPMTTPVVDREETVPTPMTA